jgi:hypothetical protein
MLRMVQSIDDLIGAIREDSSGWRVNEPKWFRGEPLSDKPLLPTLYRASLSAHENPLLQMFRARASGFHDPVPDRSHTDQWLFLARHAGLPTRLLDWTEGALVALHFALKEEKPVLWMLNPLDLNDLSYTVSHPKNAVREFPLHWVEAQPPQVNPAFENLAGAWELDRRGVDLPVAIYPTYVHPRLTGQRACFTIHGRKKDGLNSLVPDTILKQYIIEPARRHAMRRELQLLGITQSVLFPELDGLAAELTDRYME